MSSEPKEFSRSIENLIAGFRALPEDQGRSRRRPTVDLGKLVDELLVKHRISHDSLEHSIREKWPEIVGIANASYSHPLVVEKSLLVVLVSHAVVPTNCSCTRRPSWKNSACCPAVAPSRAWRSAAADKLGNPEPAASVVVLSLRA